MSKKAATLVAAFNKAAQAYGSAQALGKESLIRDAELAHQEAFDKLRRYITRLETLREQSLQPSAVTEDAKRFCWLEAADWETVLSVAHRAWRCGYDLRVVIDERINK
jgi:hypothetical protein